MLANVFSYSFCTFASCMQEELRNMDAEEKAAIIQALSSQLLAEGRTDHKALYLLFLNHPEGIEFKNLVDYREELLQLYQKIGNRIDMDKITETVNRLVNPLDNAINEKCSRIKAAFSDMMETVV